MSLFDISRFYRPVDLSAPDSSDDFVFDRVGPIPLRHDDEWVGDVCLEGVFEKSSHPEASKYVLTHIYLSQPRLVDGSMIFQRNDLPATEADDDDDVPRSVLAEAFATSLFAERGDPCWKEADAMRFCKELRHGGEQRVHEIFGSWGRNLAEGEDGVDSLRTADQIAEDEEIMRELEEARTSTLGSSSSEVESQIYQGILHETFISCDNVLRQGYVALPLRQDSLVTSRYVHCLMFRRPGSEEEEGEVDEDEDDDCGSDSPLAVAAREKRMRVRVGFCGMLRDPVPEGEDPPLHPFQNRKGTSTTTVVDVYDDDDEEEEEEDGGEDEPVFIEEDETEIIVEMNENEEGEEEGELNDDDFRLVSWSELRDFERLYLQKLPLVLRLSPRQLQEMRLVYAVEPSHCSNLLNREFYEGLLDLVDVVIPDYIALCFLSHGRVDDYHVEADLEEGGEEDLYAGVSEFQSVLDIDSESGPRSATPGGRDIFSIRRNKRNEEKKQEKEGTGEDEEDDDDEDEECETHVQILVERIRSERKTLKDSLRILFVVNSDPDLYDWSRAKLLWPSDVGTKSDEEGGPTGRLQAAALVNHRLTSFIVLHTPSTQEDRWQRMTVARDYLASLDNSEEAGVLTLILPLPSLNVPQARSRLNNWLDECKEDLEREKKGQTKKVKPFASLNAAVTFEKEERLRLVSKKESLTEDGGPMREKLEQLLSHVDRTLPKASSYGYWWSVMVVLGYTMITTIKRRLLIYGIIFLFVQLTEVAAVWGLAIYITVDLLASFLYANRFFITLCKGRPPYRSMLEMILRFEVEAERKLLILGKVGFCIGVAIIAAIVHFVLAASRDGDFTCQRVSMFNETFNATDLTNGTYGLFSIPRLFYADLFQYGQVPQVNCSIVSYDFADFYKGMVIGLLDLVITIFRFLFYDGPACEEYIDNFDTLDNQGVELPRLNIGFVAFIGKSPKVILEEMLNTLHWMRSRGYLDPDSIVADSSSSHLETSYFDGMSPMDLGFLQYFFIDGMDERRKKKQKKTWKISGASPSGNSSQAYVRATNSMYLENIFPRTILRYCRTAFCGRRRQTTAMRWTKGSTLVVVFGVIALLGVFALCLVIELVSLFFNGTNESLNNPTWTIPGFWRRMILYFVLLGVCLFVTLFSLAVATMMGESFTRSISSVRDRRFHKSHITAIMDNLAQAGDSVLAVGGAQRKRRCCAACFGREAAPPPYRNFCLSCEFFCGDLSTLAVCGFQCNSPLLEQFTTLWVMCRLVFLGIVLAVAFVIIVVVCGLSGGVVAFPFFLLFSVFLCLLKCRRGSCDEGLCVWFVKLAFSSICGFPAIILYFFDRVIRLPCVKGFSAIQNLYSFVILAPEDGDEETKLHQFLQINYCQLQDDRVNIRNQLGRELDSLLAPVSHTRVPTSRRYRVKEKLTQYTREMCLRNIARFQYLSALFEGVVDLDLIALQKSARQRRTLAEEYSSLLREFQFSLGLWYCKTLLQGEGTIPECFLRKRA